MIHSGISALLKEIISLLVSKLNASVSRKWGGGGGGGERRGSTLKILFKMATLKKKLVLNLEFENPAISNAEEIEAILLSTDHDQCVTEIVD